MNKEQPAQQAEPNINLNDLRIMAKIIEISTERGAFKANELRSVGDIYEKLVTFVNSAQEAQQSSQDVEPSLEEEESKENNE